jgi:LuxR family maltose regulon positive regulatory protein
LNLRAWLAFWGGDVSAARELCREVAQEAHWLGDPASMVAANQVLASQERSLCGDYAAAQRILRDLADAAGRGQRPGRLIYVNLLGRLATVSEDWDAASQALRTIETAADKPEWPSLVLLTATLRAELALHGGDADEAVSLLRPLVDRAMDGDSFGANVRLRVALARALLRAGTTASAWSVLNQGLRQAMEAGQPLGLLLCGPAALDELALAPWGTAADTPGLAYLRQCSAHARQLQTSSASIAPSASPSEDTLLTERELQVLELVAQGQSNKLIARALDLSPHTVKRHMARIFDKTGQSARGQVAAWYVHRSAGGAQPRL